MYTQLKIMQQKLENKNTDLTKVLPAQVQPSAAKWHDFSTNVLEDDKSPQLTLFYSASLGAEAPVTLANVRPPVSQG